MREMVYRRGKTSMREVIDRQRMATATTVIMMVALLRQAVSMNRGHSINTTKEESPGENDRRISADAHSSPLSPCRTSGCWFFV